MPESHNELFVHLVWSTKNRLPLLTDAVRGAVYKCIEAGCSRAAG